MSRALKKEVASLKRRVGRIPRPAPKFTNTTFSSATPNVWAQVLLNGIAEGDQDFERDGDIVNVTGWDMRLRMRTDLATGSAASVRVLVIYDRQSNGTQFDPDDYFLANDNILGHADPARRMRFRALFDRTYNLQEYAANAAVDTHLTLPPVKKHYKRPIKCQYVATGSAITAIETGSIHYMIITDRASQGPTVDLDFMLYWYSD